MRSRKESFSRGEQTFSDGEVDTRDSDGLLSSRGSGGTSSAARIGGSRFVQWLGSWWRIIVSVLTPILLLPLPLLWTTAASRTLYVIGIIAVYWVTEIIPIACTSLLPLVLFPALGILSADATARNYLKDINMLFVGGLMMAVAVERWNLHKRLALLVLMAVGSKPKWLLFGFMSITGFLSMWISNTATAAMMLPIAQAVLLQIKDDEPPKKESDEVATDSSTEESPASLSESRSTSVKFSRIANGSKTVDSNYESLDEAGTDNVHIDPPLENGSSASSNLASMSAEDCEVAQVRTPDAGYLRMAKSLMLGVAYAANIGGTGTLTGTGPNIVLAGMASDLGINFGLWFIFAAPAMIVALLVAWLYLSFLYCDDCFSGVKRRFFHKNLYQVSGHKSKDVIRAEYKKLGRIRYAEVILSVMFILLVFLWLFRDPGFIPGWGSFFTYDDNTSFVTDSTSVIAVVFLLFLIPSEPCCCTWSNVLKAGRSRRLLDWDSIQKTLPWNVVFILGSGFAIAEAAEESGLSEWLGDRLNVLHSVPPFIIAFMVSIVVAMATEFISNVATTTLFLPILRSLAISLCVHPLYFMIPATVSASYAFMFPVATPPNAVAFSYGYLRVRNMALTGLAMNTMCVLIVTTSLNVIALPLFKLHQFPSDILNATNCYVNDSIFV